MITVRYGGKAGPAIKLAEAKSLLVVRSRSRALPTEVAVRPRARRAMSELTPVLDMPEPGVQVFAAPRAPADTIKRARSALKNERGFEFVGTPLVDAVSGRPVVYTENAFIKFRDDVPETKRRSLLSSHNLKIKRKLEYAPASYFVGGPEGIGQKIFTVTAKLLNDKLVELCHPELTRKRALRTAFPQQWHLKKTTIDGHVINASANVVAAWAKSRGDGITIAVIDDGVDLEHEEFQSNGKIVAPRDVTRGSNDPRPGKRDEHGHACAGVACADGLHGASGVAPNARLMPIRLASALGSQREADAFAWACDHGADVISCSWGPEDGDWEDASDPLHQQEYLLPDSTRLAIDYALTQGRGGKGCVIVWAAGNGNESVDLDGYASYPGVLAVAACTDAGKRSAYSDKGKALWCAFPSDDGYISRTPGIWTTDLSGPRGYNDGNPALGDAAGNYCNDFGGTSSAAPGAAGVAALILSRNPALTAVQVRDIMRRCCNRIDKAGGRYDSKGHSNKYGYGRLNAKKAVDLS
jgi:subtilisin family serine protease